MIIDTAMATSGVTATPKPSQEDRPTTSFGDTLLAAAQSGRKSIVETEEISDIEKIYREILDKGFSQWTQEMRKEELEKKLREEILSSLGLTEEELGFLPAEKIAEIEKSIMELMQQIMADNGQDKAREQREKGQVYVPVIAGAVG